MRIRVSIGGLLEKPSGRSELELDLPDGSTVRDLLKAVGYSDAHASRVMASVRGTIRKQEYALADRDQVKLSILVGGG